MCAVAFMSSCSIKQTKHNWVWNFYNIVKSNQNDTDKTNLNSIEFHIILKSEFINNDTC